MDPHPPLIRYWEFARRCKAEFRYLRDPDCENFLTVVARSAKTRELVWPADSPLYRAQLGCEFHEVVINEDGDTIDEEHPFSALRMKPIPGAAREGRANSKGIPVLYLSADYHTATCEVRPHLQANVTVATFQAVRALRLVDCSVEHNASIWSIAFGEDKGPTDATIWAAVDRAFAEPLHETDTAADYVPTQILAEHFRRLEFDGIQFKSSVGPGMNVVLFDPALAFAKSAQVLRIKRVEYFISDPSWAQTWTFGDGAADV